MVLTLLLSFFSASPSLAGWTQVASPTSENLNGTWFADATTGVCVGDNGAVARTSDGMSFQDYSISGGTNLNGVHFAPDVVGVVSYENFEAYTEEDQPSTSPPGIITINPSTTDRYEVKVQGVSVIGESAVCPLSIFMVSTLSAPPLAGRSASTAPSSRPPMVGLTGVVQTSTTTNQLNGTSFADANIGCGVWPTIKSSRRTTVGRTGQHRSLLQPTISTVYILQSIIHSRLPVVNGNLNGRKGLV